MYDTYTVDILEKFCTRKAVPRAILLIVFEVLLSGLELVISWEAFELGILQSAYLLHPMKGVDKVHLHMGVLCSLVNVVHCCDYRSRGILRPKHN